MIDARGPTRLVPSRPGPDPGGEIRACSLRRPVCVHGSRSLGPGPVARALGRGESALDGLVALRLPLPLSDFAAGGGPELDVYLRSEQHAPAAVVELAARGPTWDHEPAFVLAPPPRGVGCVESALLAAAIAEAALFGLDSGVERSLSASVASHLASLVAPCSLEETAAIDTLMRAPDRGFAIDDDTPEATRGGRLFFAWLEERYGSGRPGELAVSLVAAAPQRTAPGSLWFHNEPDIVDVLRSNARAGGSPPFGVLLREYAVALAFVGSRSDDAHLLDVARYGELGRVRFEWNVPWSSLPRRLAPARPILPTGSSYVWIDLAGAPDETVITLQAEWEPPTRFLWAIVKVGPDGDERGRVLPPTTLGATTMQQSLAGLGGLAGLVVVAVNEGGSSAIDPHDPDDGPFQGQSYMLTVHPE